MIRNRVLIVLFLTVGIVCFASAQNAPGDGSLVRLAYQNTYPVVWRDTSASPRVCLAVYETGLFQLSKTVEQGTLNLEGRLPRKDLSRLGKILQQSPSPKGHGGIVFNASESFVAEIISDKATKHFDWVNPDGSMPFPESIQTVVDWLRNFQPEDAHQLTLKELSDHPICPTGQQTPRPIA